MVSDCWANHIWMDSETVYRQWAEVKTPNVQFSLDVEIHPKSFV